MGMMPMLVLRKNYDLAEKWKKGAANPSRVLQPSIVLALFLRSLATSYRRLLNLASSVCLLRFLIGGRDGDGFKDDVWSWRGPGYDWVKDYAAGTEQEFYLDKNSKVRARASKRIFLV